MIPEPNGTRLVFRYPNQDTACSLDVIAWDNDGNALVADPRKYDECTGGLVKVADLTDLVIIGFSGRHDRTITALLPSDGWSYDIDGEPVVAWGLCHDGVARPLYYDSINGYAVAAWPDCELRPPRKAVPRKTKAGAQ